MKEQIISFATAKLAKEKGFDGQCYDAYWDEDHKYSDGYLEHLDEYSESRYFTDSKLDEDEYLAPTQGLLQQWLRVEHNIWISMAPREEKEGEETVFRWCWGILGKEVSNGYPSYEEALEEGLRAGLDMIKED